MEIIPMIAYILALVVCAVVIISLTMACAIIAYTLFRLFKNHK